MRKTLIAVGIAGTLGAGVGSIAAAEISTPPPPDHSRRMEETNAKWQGRSRHETRRDGMRGLARKLDLSESQRTQLRHLRAQTMADIWSARADGHLTVDQLRERIETARHAERTQFRNLLTPEQRTRLEQMKKHSEHARQAA